MKFVKLVWVNVGKIKFQSLLSSILSGIFFLLLKFLVHFAFFPLEPFDSLSFFFFARDNLVFVLE